MKKYLLAAATLLAVSCGSSHNPAASQDEAENESNTQEVHCYLRTEGTHHEDTAAIMLTINDSIVTGSMKYLPHEKDARIGPIKGNKAGNILTLNHMCSQEGLDFTVPVVLKMEQNKVLQKSTTFNEDGEEIIAENAPYDAEYISVDCSTFPQRNF